MLRLDILYNYFGPIKVQLLTDCNNIAEIYLIMQEPCLNDSLKFNFQYLFTGHNIVKCIISSSKVDSISPEMIWLWNMSACYWMGVYSFDWIHYMCIKTTLPRSTEMTCQRWLMSPFSDLRSLFTLLFDEVTNDNTC